MTPLPPEHNLAMIPLDGSKDDNPYEDTDKNISECCENPSLYCLILSYMR